MRFTIVGCLLTVFLANALAGPIKKISEKKSLVENTKLDKEAPKIDEIGTDKDRSKKSTTTFCVEIRPGSNEPVQCSCKDKEAHNQHLAAQQIPQAISYAATQPAQLQPASPPHSVNIIHAPAQPPQTLNIIQPAPTLHAVQFLQPQSPQGPSSVQTLNFLQPSVHKSEPYHQTINFGAPSHEEEKPSNPIQYEKIIEFPSEPTPNPAPEPINEKVVPESTPQPAPEVIVVPQPAPEVVIIPQPAPQPTPEPIPTILPQPTPQPEHTDSAHKSEVHVSVTTEDKKNQEEHKSQPESFQIPVEPAHVLPYDQKPQSYQEQVVVVPNPILVEHQENCPAAFIQIPSIRYQPSESVIQFPGSSYQPAGSSFQQAGQFQTECSCKQTRPINSNLHLANPSSSLRHHHDKNPQIVPMVIYPPPIPTISPAPLLGGHQSHAPYHGMVSLSGQPSGQPPLVISMQSIRNKEGMQEKMTDMTGMTGMTDMTGMTARNHDQTSNTLNNINSEVQPKDFNRQTMTGLENRNGQHDKEMGPMMNEVTRPRYIRDDKNAKIIDTSVETKKINEKSSSIKKD
ncbi:PREDICTED: putative ankyrin repeat protein RF_0987 [Polistes canadensis]|uniref:putative ankyrin repeat protein RF_0987 n=1 Tax=Polistes canadensis TaxID=91411 RepID=UPI000718C95D|nr:PREDICTED: putative ankyrin repeat protein RF_0987 [Polistes canadensis]